MSSLPRTTSLAAVGAAALVALAGCSSGGAVAPAPAPAAPSAPAVSAPAASAPGAPPSADAPKPSADPCAGIPDTATIAAALKWPAGAQGSQPQIVGARGCTIKRLDYAPGSVVVFRNDPLSRWTDDEMDSEPDSPYLPGAKVGSDRGTAIKTATSVKSVNVINGTPAENDKAAAEILKAWK